jgi:exopolysaccharide biosynthesis predicted pyruvyltransferase EpsI
MTDDRAQPLQRLFAAVAGRPVLFVRPGGNWGDHLIWLGAEHLATSMGVRWRSLDHTHFNAGSARRNEVIFVHGSGGFTRTSSGRAAQCLASALRTPGATVIQGPCTVDTVEDVAFLRPAMDQAVAAALNFMVRERRSEALMRPLLAGRAEVVLNQDTAFYLPRETLLRWADRAPGRLTLWAVREDPEAVRTSGRPRADGVVLDPARYARSFAHWLRIHVAARRIITNRTHSAICGALLGVPVTMFSGGYHKNRSIWDFSLQDRGVRWLDDVRDVPARPSVDPWLRWAPPRVRESWKAGRLADRLRGVPYA